MFNRTATIRHATQDDAERIFELIVALASHHGQSEYVRTNTAELRLAGFGDVPRFGALLSESGETVIGFLSYTICYYIWLGELYMRIDDVFVCPEFRGIGTGKELMLESKRYSESLGLRRIKWEVEADNNSAIRFYQSLGATYYEKGIFSWTV